MCYTFCGYQNNVEPQTGRSLLEFLGKNTEEESYFGLYRFLEDNRILRLHCGKSQLYLPISGAVSSSTRRSHHAASDQNGQEEPTDGTHGAPKRESIRSFYQLFLLFVLVLDRVYGHRGYVEK